MPSLPPGRALVLLAEDLRLEDNLAFAMAYEAGRDGMAVVRVLPEARGQPLRTRNRRELEEAAERRIQKQLSANNLPFEVLDAGQSASLVPLCKRFGCASVIRNAADGMATETAHLREWERQLAFENSPY